MLAPVTDRPAPPPAPSTPPVPPAARPIRPARTDQAKRAERSQLRRMIIGLVALPLTALPFVAYAQLTPEGRLVRDRALVRLFPPSLPKLSAGQRAAAVAVAPRYNGAVMALAYHGIGSASDAEGGFVISPERFAEHLATLKAAGMNTVTAAQVADSFAGGSPLPPNAVMLSFDDGRADAMMFADPLLAQAGMSATMFVIADAASKPGVYYASWDRIEAYARSGRWDIQSHTAASHREQKVEGGPSLPALTSRTPRESMADYRKRISRDLAKAGSAIERHVGRRPMAFAYPFGAYGADRSNDPAIAATLREEVTRQYAVAFQQDDQETVPLLTPDQDRLRLRREEVQNWSGLELLKRIGRARQSLTVVGDAVPALTGPGVPPPVSGGPPTPAGDASSAATSAAAGVAPAPSPGTASAPGAGAPTAVAAGPTPVAGTPPAVTPTPVVTSPPPVLPPPSTTVPTIVPPATSPTTTICTPAGNSGKCRPGNN